MIPRPFTVGGLFLLGVLLQGCVTTSPPTLFYTLNATAKAAQQSSPLSVGVLLTGFPELADRPQLVVRASPNRLLLLDQHHWAGSLRRQFLRTLSEDLGQVTGSRQVWPGPWEENLRPDRRLTLDLQQFEGTLGQEAILQASWTVKDQEGKVIKNQVTRLQEPAPGAHEELVAAESRLVARLAQEIADAL